MDRVIKFRGKRIDTGQWVYGYLSFIYVNGRNDNGFIYSDKASIYSQDDARAYDVIAKTVGQYTGMNDRNDEEIYEGDLLKYHPLLSSTKKYHLRLVIWNKDNGSWRFKKCPAYFDGPDFSDDTILMKERNRNKHSRVGNIHDNLDLLK